MCEIEGFILAGGASSRMRRDKSRLELGGMTFVERAALALRAIAPENITLVGAADDEFLAAKARNRLAIKMRVINDEAIEDQADGAQRARAAIVGLYTALKRAEAEWLAVLACDLPFVSGELFERLVFLAQNRQTKSVDFEAVVPIQPDGTPQPLCALYRRAACLKAAGEMLAGDDWSLRELVRRVATRFVEFDEISDLRRAEHFFLNVNTPEDYAAAQAVLAKTL